MTRCNYCSHSQINYNYISGLCGITTKHIGPIIFEGFNWDLFDNCSPFLHINLKRILMAHYVCIDSTNWTSLLHCNFKSPSTEELSFLNTNGYENGQESLDRWCDKSYFKKGGFTLACGLRNDRSDGRGVMGYVREMNVAVPSASPCFHFHITQDPNSWDGDPTFIEGGYSFLS